MRRLLPIFLFLTLVALEASSQTMTRMQGWGLDLHSSHWSSAQQGVAVGEKLIIRTEDGGTTWEEVLQRFDLRFYDVLFLDSSRGLAVGEGGAIFLSTDAGKTWQKKEAGTVNDLFALAQIPGGPIVAAGEKGELIQSLDGGETWKKLVSGTALDLYDVYFVGESTGFIVASDGKILKSQDKGNTWTLDSAPSSVDLFGVAFSSELIGYAVGENGTFLKTIDGGASWTVLSPGTSSTLRKVAISPLDARIVVAVGDMATVVRTANSGTTFAKPSLGTGNVRNLHSIAFKPSSNLATTVGQDGYLINSSNSGASWSQKFAGIRNDFTTADFKDQNTGFIAGQDGAFFVTTNGATSLVSRPLPEPVTIKSLAFWNTAFGYSGSDQGKIYRSSNSGSSWVPVFTAADRTITGFYLFAPSVIYLSGSQGYISRSFDSGVTWDQSVSSNTLENLKGLIFFDFGYGVAIGEKGQISRTFGGSIWETVPKVTEQNLNALAKIDTSRAVVVGDGGIILKTEDKASTWKIIASGTTKNLKSIDFFGTEYGFISGEEGLALVTSDGGETWREFATGTLRDLNAVSAGTDLRAYFAGDDGTVLSFSCVPPTGNVGEISGGFQACLGTASYSISAAPQLGSEILWRVDGGEILSGQGTPQIEVRWTETGRNAVLVSRTNFCGSGETSALEVSVAASPPSTQAIAGEGAVCSGASYSYSLPSQNGISYTWAVTGGEIKSGQGSHQVEVVWAQQGEQRISVIQENYCGPSPSLQKTISVASTPSSPSSIAGATMTSLVAEIYSIDPIAGLNYRWSISGGGGKILSGQGSASVTVVWEKEGDFELAVEAQNACGYSTKRILSVNVNLITALEPTANTDLKLYPNPSQGTVTLTSDSLDSWSSLTVTNSLGQPLRELTISSGQREVYLESLPKGLLLLQLKGKDGQVTKKLLVR